MSRDFLNSRNKFRRVYSSERQPPVNVEFVINDVTQSFNQNSLVISRNHYIVIGNNGPATETVTVTGYYDEDFVNFDNTSEETKTFNITFPRSPIVVLIIEPTGYDDDNINVFLLDVNEGSLTVGTSAPFSGSIRYLAVHSDTSYPATLFRSILEPSSYYTISAGTSDVVGSSFTGSFTSLGSIPSNIFITTYDETSNGLANVSVADSGSYSMTGVSGSFSDYTNTKVNFLAIA